jgi:LysM repeat protein
MDSYRVSSVMKVLTLTSSLLTALALTAFGQGDSTLRSEISLKEKQLTEIQKELTELRRKLQKPSTGSYPVRTGDTVHSIARRHNVSASDIMTWNAISDPTKLGIGDLLVVSASAPKTIASPSKKTTSTPPSESYVISKGDTFYSIARLHKMSLAQLRTLNPDVSTHQILPGQTLKILGKAPTKSQSTAKNSVVVVKKTTQPKPQPVAKTPKKTDTSSQTVSTENRPAKTPERMAKRTSQAPISTPPSPPVVKDPEPRASAAAIILTDEITFDAFASKHGTSTNQLNALNGWNLPKSTVLARGSEIFVPN